MIKVKDWFYTEFYGKNVLVRPNATLFIQAKNNLRATIKSKREIRCHDYIFVLEFDRDVPSLFWEENIISSGGNTYIFETNYCTKSDEILPLSYLKQIPKRLNKKFLKKVPRKISRLADKLVGNENDTKKILKKFHEFVYEHEKTEDTTTAKSFKKLLKEYEKEEFFYGNCKEARDFFAALCNSKGLPTKKVCGRYSKPVGHVWVDVFVPTKQGYKLFPVDPALGFFEDLSEIHKFFEPVPSLNADFLQKALDFFRGDYFLDLKIEPKD